MNMNIYNKLKTGIKVNTEINLTYIIVALILGLAIFGYSLVGYVNKERDRSLAQERQAQESRSKIADATK